MRILLPSTSPDQPSPDQPSPGQSLPRSTDQHVASDRSVQSGPQSIADQADVHRHYADDWLEAGGVRANFVSSADGAATVAGLSRGLQTPGDNTVFAALRDLADVIVVGAATAAAENYRPSDPSARRRAIRTSYGLAPAPATAVLSASLDLDLSAPLFSTATEAPTLVVTGSAAPVSRRNDIIDIAGGPARLQLVEAPTGRDGGVDIAAAIASLRELGYRRIMCEGGPRLFAAAIAAGVVDELCLSISPLLAGPAARRIVDGPDWPAEWTAKLSLVGLLTEDDALFCRYRVER